MGRNAQRKANLACPAHPQRRRAFANPPHHPGNTSRPVSTPPHKLPVSSPAPAPGTQSASFLFDSHFGFVFLIMLESQVCKGTLTLSIISPPVCIHRLIRTSDHRVLQIFALMLTPPHQFMILCLVRACILVIPLVWSPRANLQTSFALRKPPQYLRRSSETLVPSYRT